MIGFGRSVSTLRAMFCTTRVKWRSSVSHTADIRCWCCVVQCTDSWRRSVRLCSAEQSCADTKDGGFASGALNSGLVRDQGQLVCTMQEHMQCGVFLKSPSYSAHANVLAENVVEFYASFVEINSYFPLPHL